MKMARLEVWRFGAFSNFLFNFLFLPKCTCLLLFFLSEPEEHLQPVMFGNLDSPVTNLIHYTKVWVWLRFMGICQSFGLFRACILYFNCNSEWQLYYFQLVPCSVSALTEKKKKKVFLIWQRNLLHNKVHMMKPTHCTKVLAGYPTCSQLVSRAWQCEASRLFVVVIFSMFCKGPI